MPTEASTYETPATFKLTVEGDPNVAVFVMPEAEWEMHKQRVESLCQLLEKMFAALGNNPMFRAMIPPDVLKDMSY